jgi:hypothetical protein
MPAVVLFFLVNHPQFTFAAAFPGGFFFALTDFNVQ